LVENGYAPLLERIGMKAAAVAFADGSNLETAQTLARIGQAPLVRDGSFKKLPGMLGGWTASRDLKAIPAESFRDWWAKRPAKKEHA
jgi:L-lactate dehydrogenase complex protein LldF